MRALDRGQHGELTAFVEDGRLGSLLESVQPYAAEAAPVARKRRLPRASPHVDIVPELNCTVTNHLPAAKLHPYRVLQGCSRARGSRVNGNHLYCNCIVGRWRMQNRHVKRQLSVFYTILAAMVSLRAPPKLRFYAYSARLSCGLDFNGVILCPSGYLVWGGGDAAMRGSAMCVSCDTMRQG